MIARLAESPDRQVGPMARAFSKLSASIAWLGWRPWHYAALLIIHIDLLRFAAAAGPEDWPHFFYPWADALRLSILKYHQFPWWNPWVMCGQPLFAEPQSAIAMPDTLFILAFGSVVGLKLVVLFYVWVGYEGTRRLCRQLFGTSPFVDGISLIPAIVPALALHLTAGHLVLVGFCLFPWLLVFAMTWERSYRQSLGLGIALGAYVLCYIHYSIIMAFTLALPVAIRGLFRTWRSGKTWLRVALVLCTAMALSFLRLGTTLDIVARFPRVDPDLWHYPVVNSVEGVLGTLIEPLQTRDTGPQIAGLGWWELGSYTGLLALLLAYESWRSGNRRFWPIHLAALFCIVCAWNNGNKLFPGYWLHVTLPWKYMVIPTRWRVFGSYFVLLAAAYGLVVLRQRGRARVAALLAALVVMDLGYNTYYIYKGIFVVVPPAFAETEDPPGPVDDTPYDTWTTVRNNHVSMGIETPLLGWGSHRPSRVPITDPHYAGEFHGTQPVRLVSWSPNRIALEGTPGDTVTLNMNPSSYWIMNGVRLFPNYRAFEINKPFQVTVPPEGEMVFLARPPHLVVYVLVQALFGVACAFLVWQLARLERRAA